MAQIKVKTLVEPSFIIHLDVTEDELHMLNAIAGYNNESLADAIISVTGMNGLKAPRQRLLDFIKHIREESNSALFTIKKTREALP